MDYSRKPPLTARIRATRPWPIAIEVAGIAYEVGLLELHYQGSSHIVASQHGGTSLISESFNGLALAARAWHEGWTVHTRMSGAPVIRALLAAGLCERIDRTAQHVGAES